MRAKKISRPHKIWRRRPWVEANRTTGKQPAPGGMALGNEPTPSPHEATRVPSSRSVRVLCAKLTSYRRLATPRCTCPEGYRQLLETNDNGTRRSSSTNLTNAHSNANVANAVPLDGRKVILKFCIRYLGCDHGKSCYCCQQAQENCYDTLEECHDNCPACDLPPVAVIAWINGERPGDQCN